MREAAEPGGRPGAGRNRRGVAQERGERGDSRDAADAAEALGCDRGELLCARGDFAHGAGKRAMNYRITHRTLYEYAAPVSVSQHVARLTPRATAAQSC